MSKSKQRERQEITLFVIVLVVVLFMGGLYLLSLFGSYMFNPKFTITQNICQNDVVSLNNNLICKSSCLYGISNTLGINDNTNELQRRNLIKDCNAFCDEKLPTEQKCETKNVDKIETPESMSFGVGWTRHCEEIGKLFGEDSYKSCIESYTELDKDYIKKSDLNKTWLNSNCINYHVECTNKNPMRGVYDANGNPISCSNYKEDLWKCGDYEVKKI